jgi:uncharacterized protein GlcG (DUF336 family)
MAMYSSFSLDLGDAKAIAAACLASAHAQGVAVSIAVVDGAGQLLQFSRMDGARGFSVDLATKKARAAAHVGVPTAIIAAMSGPGADAVKAGGLPILHEGHCVGAVGISGAQTAVDERIAADGIAAFGT